MSRHRLATIEGDERHVAVCECGWRSDPAWLQQVAEGRWLGHVRTLQLAALRHRGELRKADAARHHDKALALWFSAIAAHHRVFQRAAASRGSAGAVDPMRCGDGRPLETARTLAGLSLLDLWARYVQLGGASGEQEFERWLRGVQPIGSFDHDVTALALNEHFTDAGFGQPVDYWR